MSSKGKTCCPNCGSTSIENDDPSGNSICTVCGVIVEENNIVSSVEFMEGAGGQSSMMGQFVGANGSKPFSGAATPSSRYGLSRDSRETTLANGRKRIQDVASRLHLGVHYVDAAARFFTLAVEKHFVQGRRTTHVVAACLYIACRQEKSQHMLIDFSDALQVNVYTLGTTFLKFRRILAIKLEIIDPALYIYRFAAHLDLDEKANAVALTALRLVGRMKRDWIVCGRRPAGICAAALLIAARAHGFTRSDRDVTRVLRVCGLTVHHRVRDFENTPSANLSLEQFMTLEIGKEADPPRFTSNRIREARAQAIRENNVELLTSGKLDDPRISRKHAARWRLGTNLTKRQKRISTMYKKVESEMKTDNATDLTNDNDEEEEEEEAEEEDGDENAQDDDDQTAQAHDAETKSTQLVERNQLLSTKGIKFPIGNNGKALVLPNQATAEELQKSLQPEEDKINLESWKREMPTACIDEIDSLFRSDEEIKQKEAIFNKLNRDYIEKQERKEAERIAEDNLRKEKDEEHAAQAEERERYYNKQKMKRRQQRGSGDPFLASEDVDGEGEAPTTEEALIAALSSRKISRKINYDAMSSIFDESGTFSTENVEDNEPEKDFQEEQFEMV